ncbi:MAG: glycosyltransferase [Kiritimatiellae bacterium]|nr:glycosyltransferase [Kiritimatiellia bacterium]
MTVVKVIGARWTCMKPGEPLEKGEYLFTGDPGCDRYDWLVVYDELPRRREYPGLVRGRLRIACPPERTILVTQEPTSVKYYNRVYTDQFGHLLTNRPFEAERHHHYHFGRGYYAWFIDRRYPEARAFVAPPKTRIVSAVYTGKRMKHTKHYARSVLLDYLMEHVDGLDRFGRGIRPIERKEDALDAYRYHLAVENHIAPGHWSEKIADALLCECLPFYAGDPDLGRTLPPDSFIPIPIDDPPRAAEIINGAIAAGEYEKRLPAVREARKLILERYNFRDQVIEVIESAKDSPVTPVDAARPFFLLSRRRTRLTVRGACGDVFHHALRLFGR